MTPEERRAARRAIKYVQHVQSASAKTLTDERSPHLLRLELATLNKEVVAYFYRNPDALYTITPRQFEELIAGILKDMGADVHLTPRTRDKGRDILAVFKTPVADVFFIVECKRNRADRPVGIDVVERFLYVLDRKDNASCGLIATTSYFSPDALKTAHELKYRLRLKDFEGIREWLRNYGQWIHRPGSELWVPNPV